MRQVLTAILSIMMLISLAACAPESGSSSGSSAAVQTCAKTSGCPDICISKFDYYTAAAATSECNPAYASPYGGLPPNCPFIMAKAKEIHAKYNACMASPPEQVPNLQ